ncbi:MAG: DUF2933 domain-containing protein [Candidatus Rokubacteria bacterium]|nr:DUF2933 domain-containing protein [Candidatus Rokubacteria bacterium]
MAKLERERIEAGGGENGAAPPGASAAERYCTVCGTRVNPDGPPIERFGEPFCSEAHATEFVDQVRGARVRHAATPPAAAPACAMGAGGAAAPGQRWKAYSGRALCWGAPLLVLVVLLVGGTGALTGAAGAILPTLAFLACPLGMYLMMRSMSKMGHQDDRADKGGQK